MTYHVTRDGAATLSALRSQAPLRAMRLPSRPTPGSGGKLAQPKKPVEARALWRIEIYSNPTSPKSPSKLIYSQGPWHSDPAGVMKVVQAHLAPGRHARIYRQRKANEPAAGNWMHVQMPPGSPFDLAMSGVGQYNISVPGTEQLTLPTCVPQEVKAWAQSQCQAVAPHGYDTLGQWGSPGVQTFLPLQLDPYAFDWAKAPVCQVAALPVCPPPAGGGDPETGEPVPGDGDEEDGESSALVIGGLLLLVAIGGGYAYYKTRKK